jgi:hypothetical protein
MKIKNITIDLFVEEKDLLKIDRAFTNLIMKHKQKLKDYAVFIQNAERIKRVKGGEKIKL